MQRSVPQAVSRWLAVRFELTARVANQQMLQWHAKVHSPIRWMACLNIFATACAMLLLSP